MKKKAVVLFSGGLDSILSARIMQVLGIEVEAIHFDIVFYTSYADKDDHPPSKIAKELGIKLTIRDITNEFLEIVKSPGHGYGSGINPCIDCKIFMFKKAGEFMKETGASFIVTGEVLGERPMSQRMETIRLIEKRSGLNGLILRPLSAKLLEPTLPEKEGMVDREKLYAISGRGRKPQLELAKEFGIKNYPNPAGGCLLTDPAFSKRVKDLINNDELTVDNTMLLKVGRHFRLSKNCKLIVGRNEKENGQITNLAKEGDVLFDAGDVPAPVGLLRGKIGDEGIKLALGIVARYTDKKAGENVKIRYWNKDAENERCEIVEPSGTETIEKMRVK